MRKHNGSSHAAQYDIDNIRCDVKNRIYASQRGARTAVHICDHPNVGVTNGPHLQFVKAHDGHFNPATVKDIPHQTLWTMPAEFVT
jgi:hypothetical protein